MDSRDEQPVENTYAESSYAEDADPGAEDDARRNRALFAGIALAIVVILIVWWILSQLVVVPDVVGMQEREAWRAIEETGLSVSDVMRLPSSTDPAGEVVATCPEAGVRIFKWRSVRLFVVSGPGGGDDGAQGGDGDLDLAWSGGTGQPQPGTSRRPVGPPRIPQVFNMTESAAIARLARDGYRATIEYGDSSTDVKRGLVFFQDPPPDTVAPRGTLVRVRVSTGPPVLSGWQN
ncbi:MAG: PASTA domain-containing protein [Coriobacteriia bacterium]|nr:PASTA domain-containing protein [Coriobacteriia bacterium]